MNIEERRKHVSNILTSNEDRWRRYQDVKKAETDLTLPLCAFFGGVFLLCVAMFMMFGTEGYVIVGVIPIGAIFIGGVLTFAGFITFILKLRNRIVK